MKVRSGQVRDVQTQRPWSPRSFALIGHRSSGKTSVGELLLAATRVVRRAGSVDEGTSLLDWSDEEHRRRQTLDLSAAWLDHDDQPLQLIDTPGAAYLGHVRDAALGVSDAAVVVIDGGEGPTQGAVDALDAGLAVGGRPTLVVISKLDRVGDVDALLACLETAAADRGARVVPMVIPFVGSEAGSSDATDGLQGLVDLVGGQVLRYADDGSGLHSPEPIPAPLAPAVAAAWERVCEAVALTDDALLEQYLEDLELPRSVVLQGLARAVADQKILPVLLTSASMRIGAHPLLDALVRWVPAPSPPQVRDGDGRVRPTTDDDGFVGQILSCQWDRQGQPFAIIRVWAGSPGRGPWRPTGGVGPPRPRCGSGGCTGSGVRGGRPPRWWDPAPWWPCGILRTCPRGPP